MNVNASAAARWTVMQRRHGGLQCSGYGVSLSLSLALSTPLPQGVSQETMSSAGGTRIAGRKAAREQETHTQTERARARVLLTKIEQKALSKLLCRSKQHQHSRACRRTGSNNTPTGVVISVTSEALQWMLRPTLQMFSSWRAKASSRRGYAGFRKPHECTVPKR